jgi:transcriptional regulator with XRE-family HTH domain
MSRTRGYDIAIWVRAARGERTLKQFSSITRIAIGKLSQLENGKSANPTLKSLRMIARWSSGRCLWPLLQLRKPKPAKKKKP